MPKPNPHSDEEPKETNPQDASEMPYHQGPCFEELMMLVFFGPMRVECVDEVENEKEAEKEQGEESGL